MVLSIFSFSHSLTVARFLHWSECMNEKGRMHQQKQLKDQNVNKLVLTGFIHSLIRVHRQRCTLEEPKRIVDKNVNRIHNSLYIALRMCYELNLRSTTLVSELIREIYFCEGSLHSIFSIMSISHVTRMGNHITNVNNGYTIILYPGVQACNFEKVKPALMYYLQNMVPLQPQDYEHTLLMTFLPDQILNDNISDDELTTPLMAAAMRKEPDIVLTLLRYGADPLKLRDQDCKAQTPIQYIINCLNCLTAIKNFTWLKTKHDILIEETKALEIFNYFLRAILYIDVRETAELKPNCTDDGHGAQYYSVHPKLAETIYIPHFRSPPKLYHICKYNVRQLIKEAAKASIPECIKVLPVPVPIKEYLDLKT